jgi:hypothetical protein
MADAAPLEGFKLTLGEMFPLLLLLLPGQFAGYLLFELLSVGSRPRPRFDGV